MTDIAELGLMIRSDGVVVAKDRLRGMTSEANLAERAVAKLISRGGQLLGAYASWRVAEALIGKFVRSTAEAEKVTTQLRSAVRSTGGAAGWSAEQLGTYASQLQRVTSYGDEAIGSAEALLLTFTRIRGTVFKDATVAILDIATAMGTDLNSATIQVGKALNDPIQGLTALTRIGVAFTAQQKETIKEMVKLGDTAGAQRMILKELTNEFGGSAAAARGTLGGALKSLDNAFGDLFESTGAGSNELRQSVEGLIDAFQDPAFISAVQGFGTVLFQMLSELTKFVTQAWGALKQFWDWLDSKSATAMTQVSIAKEVETLNQQIIKSTEKLNATTGDRGGWFGTTWGAQEGIDNLTKRRDLLLAELNKRQDPSQFDINATFDTLANMPQLPIFTKPGAGGGTNAIVTDEQIQAAEKARAAYDKLIAGSQEYIASQNLEAQVLGMTTEQASRLRHEQELLNQAANDNIPLTEEMRNKLIEQADAMATAEERTRRLTEAYQFGQTVFKSFFADIKAELMNGSSLWDSFASAASRALDTVANKLLDMSTQGLFDMLFGALAGGLGGGSASPFTSIFSGGFTGLWASGGWTGNNAPNQPSGIVHGQEFVVRAGPAAANRSQLEAMNAGYSANDNSSGGTVVNLSVTVNGGTPDLENFVRFRLPGLVQNAVNDKRAVG